MLVSDLADCADSLTPSITDAALDAMANGLDERLRTIMSSLVRHLHVFAREVELTEAEWGI